MPAARSSSVKLPYGLLPNGDLVHVSDYDADVGLAVCPLCGGCLTARRGFQRVHHFAHHAGACSAESLLHATCKLLIQQSFRRAALAGRPYHLTWWCPPCSTRKNTDLTRHVADAHVELSGADGTRSDVLFTGGLKPVAVEVVVTHDVELETLARYASVGIPVYTTRPTWDGLSRYVFGVDAEKAFNADPNCKGCRAIRARGMSREQLLARLRDPPHVSAFIQWDLDHWGRTSTSDELHLVQQTASELVAMGFHQETRAPWRMSLDLGSDGSIVASLVDHRHLDVEFRLTSGRADAQAEEFSLECRRRRLPLRHKLWPP